MLLSVSRHIPGQSWVLMLLPTLAWSPLQSLQMLLPCSVQSSTPRQLHLMRVLLMLQSWVCSWLQIQLKQVCKTSGRKGDFSA